MKLSSCEYIPTLICVIALAVSFGASPRECGISPRNNLLYESVPSEGSGPEPKVAKISKQKDQEVIWVTYNDIAPDSRKQTTHAMRSEDGGLTWRPDSQFRKPQSSSSEETATVYKEEENGLLSRSVDGGMHWRECQLNVNGLTAQEFVSKVAKNDHATLTVNLIAVHPRDPAIVYGTLTVRIHNAYAKYIDLPGIYSSQDAGDHWSMFTQDADGRNQVERTKLAIDPSDPRRMIAHGKSGLVISIDGGQSWSPIGQQADLEAPAELKGRREEIAKRKDASSIPLFPEFTYLALLQVEFQPGNPDIIYLVTNKGLYKTQDSGRTWRLIYAGAPMYYELNSLLIDPNDPNRLFIGTRDRVLVSEDGGCHFKTIFDWKNFVHKQIDG
jgi:hypothetical protein